MNQFLIAGAVGFVSGIITARSHDIGSAHIVELIITGAVLIALSLLFTATRKLTWPLVLVGFFCLGAANTSWHLDRSTPGHLHRLMAESDLEQEVTLTGTVFKPTDIRERYTVVPLGQLQLTDANGLQQEVLRGNLYVKLYPSVGDLYSEITYGSKINLSQIRLKKPENSLNPGSFNMRQFLYNQGYFGQVSVRKSEQIAITGKDPGNFAVNLAETIKIRFLRTIKQTLPFPESSFLGGVLLGLRSGLSTEIKDTFRAAGVSHVLAVSGLHVTIITLFFMGMLSILRFPRTASFLIILTSLILFTLITGARPSTVRAAIMNSVTLLFFYYRGIKLDRSFLMGVSVAAIYILAINPLLLTEASFLFSFSAVLSLALLTRPIHAFCCQHLRGFFRIFLFFELTILFACLAINPRALVIHWHTVAAAGLLLPAGLLADRLLPPFFEFRRWPTWFATFFAAQIGIQLGMLPLTAFYFKKISVSACLANFIAIPLIGVIVQLGLFAGILAFIPTIGSWLALTLNATNYLCIKLFLATAHFFGTKFPYPDVSPPEPMVLFLYYSALAVLAGWPWIKSRVSPRLRYTVSHWNRPQLAVRLILIGILSLPLIAHSISTLKPGEKRLKITVFDPSIFYMGGGNAVLISTPGGKHFLVDAGPRYALRNDQPISIKVGERTIVPALLQSGVKNLDGVIVSAPVSGSAGGMASIISNPSIHVDTVYHGLPFTKLDGDESTDDVLKMLVDQSLFVGKYRRRSELSAWALQDLFEAIRETNTGLVSVKEGQLLCEESIQSGNDTIPFRLTVLNPPEERYTGRFSTSANALVLQVDYGDRRVLLTSNIGQSVQSNILETGGHFADLVQLPANGAQYAFLPEFYEGVKAVVVAPHPSRYAKKNIDRVAAALAETNTETFSTSESGALLITSNGSDLVVSGYASPDTGVHIP